MTNVEFFKDGSTLIVDIKKSKILNLKKILSRIEKKNLFIEKILIRDKNNVFVRKIIFPDKISGIHSIVFYGKNYNEKEIYIEGLKEIDILTDFFTIHFLGSKSEKILAVFNNKIQINLKSNIESFIDFINVTFKSLEIKNLSLVSYDLNFDNVIVKNKCLIENPIKNIFFENFSVKFLQFNLNDNEKLPLITNKKKSIINIDKLLIKEKQSNKFLLKIERINKLEHLFLSQNNEKNNYHLNVSKINAEIFYLDFFITFFILSKSKINNLNIKKAKYLKYCIFNNNYIENILLPNKIILKDISECHYEFFNNYFKNKTLLKIKIDIKTSLVKKIIELLKNKIFVIYFYFYKNKNFFIEIESNFFGKFFGLDEEQFFKTISNFKFENSIIYDLDLFYFFLKDKGLLKDNLTRTKLKRILSFKDMKNLNLLLKKIKFFLKKDKNKLYLFLYHFNTTKNFYL